MFERFTESGRRVVVLAQEESRELHHTVIGNVHLLLALIREGEASASKLLGELGISLERARAVAAYIHQSVENLPQGHIPFTREAKRALELSLRAALRRGHNFIGTAHVLEGVLEAKDETVMRFLTELGIDPQDVHAFADEAARTYRESPHLGKFGGEVQVELLEELSGVRARYLAPSGHRLPVDLKVVLERLARVEDARLEEAKARADAEARLEALRRQLNEAHKEIEELRRRASGE